MLVPPTGRALSLVRYLNEPLTRRLLSHDQGNASFATASSRTASRAHLHSPPGSGPIRTSMSLPHHGRFDRSTVPPLSLVHAHSRLNQLTHPRRKDSPSLNSARKPPFGIRESRATRSSVSRSRIVTYGGSRKRWSVYPRFRSFTVPLGPSTSTDATTAVPRRSSKWLLHLCSLAHRHSVSSLD